MDYCIGQMIRNPTLVARARISEFYDKNEISGINIRQIQAAVTMDSLIYTQLRLKTEVFHHLYKKVVNFCFQSDRSITFANIPSTRKDSALGNASLRKL